MEITQLEQITLFLKDKKAMSKAHAKVLEHLLKRSRYIKDVGLCIEITDRLINSLKGPLNQRNTSLIRQTINLSTTHAIMKPYRTKNKTKSKVYVFSERFLNEINYHI